MSNGAKVFISIVILVSAILLFVKYCNWGGKHYSKQDLENAIKQAESKYVDSINFINGQLSLKEEQVFFQNDKVISLEFKIDSLTTAHNVTKKKLRPAPVGDIISDTGFVLAPNEYVNECEECFSTMATYKKENIQLRFERDGYDTLMRWQSQIHENRIVTLQKERDEFKRAFYNSESKKSDCNITRKIKLSAMGMLSDPFLPKGGGGGLIYEDKKFNEYGGHVLLTDRGPMYLFHFAKTISLRKK